MSRTQVKLIIENFRSVTKKHVIPTAPLTILIGENSSGKTSVLAAARLAYDVLNSPKAINFNEQPFRLGSYDQIASSYSGRGGLASTFTIGCELGLGKSVANKFGLSETATIEAEFCESSAQPKLSTWTVQSGSLKVSIGDWNGPRSRVEVTFGSIRTTTQIPLPPYFSLGEILFYVQYLVTLEEGKNRVEVPEGARKPLEYLFKHLTHSTMLTKRPFAFDPIRTEPKRTYDFIEESNESSGRHIPILLATTKHERPERWAALDDAISRFGKACGLFDEIKIRSLGSRPGSPFQVNVSLRGKPRNLVDVGYGVSQVLPIIVDSILKPSAQTFLVQQPEVHLHPRAQAELGTFLGYLAENEDKNFIVETHSDYLVDRVRLDIRDGKIRDPGTVLILFFELVGGRTVIHPIKIDKMGNVVGAPKSYRKFFMQEEMRFFGVDE